MKRQSKFYISPLFVFIVVLSLIFNLMYEFLSLYILTLIHELSHLICAKSFGLKIGDFKITPIGCSVEIIDVDYSSAYKQIIIYLCGPLSFFVSWFLLLLIFHFKLISEFQYENLLQENLSLALFNLFPLYPLDGGRVLDVINRCFYPVDECIKIKKVYNFISFFPVIVLLVLKKQFVLMIFILFIILLNFFNSKKDYYNYLTNRFKIELSFKDKLSNDKKIYHFRKNYFIENGLVISEYKIIPKILLNYQNKNEFKQKYSKKNN